MKNQPVTPRHDTELVVFHGTGAEIAAFDYSFSEIGNQQLGSGFYFTDRIDTANRYASARLTDDLPKPGGESPNVIAARLAIVKPLSTQTVHRLSASTLKKIIEAAPNLDDVLWNWGDVDFEGREKVINKAVSGYASVGDNLLNTINMLSHDFFSGEFGAFAAVMRETTGYDGVIEKVTPDETHYVAWFPEQISFVYSNDPSLKPKKSRRPTI